MSFQGFQEFPRVVNNEDKITVNVKRGRKRKNKTKSFDKIPKPSKGAERRPA